jgi:hypothetical protein
MNTTIQSTPTPWGIEETTQTIYVGPLRRDGSGKIADIVCYFPIFAIKDEALKRHRANADLIVEAVNSHAAHATAIHQQSEELHALGELAEKVVIEATAYSDIEFDLGDESKALRKALQDLTDHLAKRLAPIRPTQ